MGSLEIIMGPMFSGKTELLIKKYNLASLENTNKIIAFNYFKDTRYGDNKIVSHNQKFIPCINIEKLSSLFLDVDKLSKYKYIFINEAQFFIDLKECIIKLVEIYKKNVIICGLDSDYKREKFGEIWDLIPFADHIYKLKGQCNHCMNKSLFTYRVTNEKDQEVIGTDNYIPLCRKCYLSKFE